MSYNRKLEDKTRLTINGKRYRVGNPKHTYYELYKKHGLEAVLEVMGLQEVKKEDENKKQQQEGEFDIPWASVCFFLASVLVVILYKTTTGGS
tara:strand:+ start:3537 stop:3815 length:279 start_codon:yes stop_codon:yes gene_type:complete